MCINHKSGHCQIKKLVVSAAINQVLQNSLDRLMRVSMTYPNYSYPHRDRGPLAAISIELVVAATRSATTHPSPCRSLLYTPSYAPAVFAMVLITPPSPTTRPNLDRDKSGGNSGFGLCASHVRSMDSSWRVTDDGLL
jgi:hypothetical protein